MLRLLLCWLVDHPLSINFSSPAALGGLSTSDPLNKEVINWWKQKAKEIYSLIPDFGGFLVKANSEGQPGPCDYGRTHAEGANMLADVLRSYHGIVMWRAFVYSPTDSDRAPNKPILNLNLWMINFGIMLLCRSRTVR